MENIATIRLKVCKNERKNSSKKDDLFICRTIGKESFKKQDIETILRKFLFLYKNTPFKIPHLNFHINGLNILTTNKKEYFSFESFINAIYNTMYLLNDLSFECTLQELHNNIIIRQMINEYYNN